MLAITFSNRFEALLDGLVDALAEQPANPLEAQQVIVPSRAVQRRIELATADRLGICANVEFSFLGSWLWRQIGRLVSVADVSPFAPPVLAWRIYEILADHAFVAPHARLARYARAADDLMRYELAQRIATQFDQYITYRPDWLARWVDDASVATLDTAGGHAAEDQRWQAALWRRIAGEIGTARAHPSKQFFDAVAAAGPDLLRKSGLPARAHLFCLPAIPPLYLNMLRQLARFIEVRMAVLNPCREFWFDVVDRRRLSYLAAQGTLDYHEEGNRLLAAWGKQTQAQLGLLLDDNGEARVDQERFAESPGKSLLARVQNAILDLKELPPGSLASVGNSDRSIEVHVCHSLTRELEVLHDALLGIFARKDAPHPSDVLVVTPDLDDAAPLVDAVFGTARGRRAIPYVITGRGRSTQNHAARALIDLLDVATSRVAASAVMETLQQPIIARTFDIAAPEIERIRAWIRDAGIRWGLDAAHRASMGLPATARHTFDEGLDRLFLGYALPSPLHPPPGSPATAPLDDRLPAGDAEGTDALALGSLASFVSALAALRSAASVPKPASAWMQTLHEVLATFLDPQGEEVDDLRELQSSIGTLHEQMTDGGVRGVVPYEVLRNALEAALDDPVRGGVPTGAVTFSAIPTLRDLPYKVVCAIGLDDGAFPRTSRPSEFDLMATSPRPGDRQRRDDDRNAFLDLLLAARERLHLSYTGRSVRDNTPLPPSVLIAELLDVLVPAIAPAEAGEHALAAARERLMVEHPLQPFSPRAFGAAPDPRLRSFNAEYAEALRQQVRATKAAPAPKRSAAQNAVDEDEYLDEDEIEERLAPFFAFPLPLEGEEWRNVTIDQLVRFFCYPCKYLLRHRLAIRLVEAEEELRDDEPFVADSRERGALAERLLPLYLRGASNAEIRALALAGSEFPPGRFGRRLLERELRHLELFASELAPALAPPCLPPTEATIALRIDDRTWQVSGAFGDLRPAGLVRHRYSDARSTDYLTGWIHHLFLNVIDAPGAERVTRWHSRDGIYVLRPVDDAKQHLEALLRLYARGLAAPLHFFPRAAWDYARHGGDLRRAMVTWHAYPGRTGEKDYPAYRLALRGVDDPIDAEFEETANAVFTPLLAQLDDPRVNE